MPSAIGKHLSCYSRWAFMRPKASPKVATRLCLQCWVQQRKRTLIRRDCVESTRSTSDPMGLTRQQILRFLSSTRCMFNYETVGHVHHLPSGHRRKLFSDPFVPNPNHDSLLIQRPQILYYTRSSKTHFALYAWPPIWMNTVRLEILDYLQCRQTFLHDSRYHPTMWILVWSDSDTHDLHLIINCN